MAVGGMTLAALLVSAVGNAAAGWPVLPEPVRELAVATAAGAVTIGLLGDWLIDAFRLGRRAGRQAWSGRDPV